VSEREKVERKGELGLRLEAKLGELGEVRSRF
jgi:hypothetical protein